MKQKLIANIFILCSLVFCLFFTCYSLLHPGLFHLHDTTHAARIAEMTRAIHDGHFPVFWSSNFGSGYGMALFEFYAPLPFYIGTLFYLIGDNMEWAIKFLMILSSIISFWGMYFLAKKFSNSYGGILAAAAFTLAPYRAVNLFVRGAFSESYAMAFLPWILLGIVKVIKNEKQGILILALSLAGLLLSHNLTSLMFLPILIVFTLVNLFVEKTKKSLSLKNLLIGLMLGFGLASFYVLPAFLEKNFTRVESLQSSFSGYQDHFVYIRQWLMPMWGYGGSAPWPYNDMSYFLGYGQLIGLTIAIIIIGNQKLKGRNQKYFWFYDFWFLAFGFALLMTNVRSDFIWQLFPILKIIQFPWRWLSIATVFLALMSIVPTIYIKSKFFNIIYVVLISSLVIFGNYKFFRPEKFLENPEQFYFTDGKTIRAHSGPGFIDFLPNEVVDLNPVYHLYETAEIGSVLVIENKVQKKVLQTNFTKEEKINFLLTKFPGWQAYIDKQKVKIETGDNGTMLINVPAEQHRLQLIYEGSWIVKTSILISSISLLLTLLLIYEKQKVN